MLSSGLGVGGGIILVPALVLLLACPQKSAQGMSLALVVPMAALGAIQYARMPGVHLQWLPILILMAGAIAGVLMGARLVKSLPDLWLQRAFAVLLIVVAARMLWPTQASRAKKIDVATPTVGAVTLEKETSHARN